MNDSNVHCEYHVKRNAITKCEMCGKTVCVECKMVYQQRHTIHYGGMHHGGIHSHHHHHSHSYYTRHELCQPCYYDRRVKALKSPQQCCIVIFGLLFAIVAGIMLSSIIEFNARWEETAPSDMQGPEIGIPIAYIMIAVGVIVMIGGIVNMFTIPKRISDLEAKKEAFFKKLSSTETEQKTPPEKNYCTTCGDMISEGEIYCDKCGIKH